MNTIFKRLAAFLFLSIFFSTTSQVLAVSLGGYGADTASDTQILSGSSTTLDVIDKTNTLSAGTVRRADLYFPGNFLTRSIRFKVWRQNGTDFDLVGESGSYSLTGSTTQGQAKNTLVLTTPITAQAGDYIGIGMSSNFMNIGMKLGSYTSKYKVGSDVTSGSVAESGFTSTAAALSIKYYDDDYLTSIAPSTSYNDQSQSITIVGRGFQVGATVKLTKTGQTDVVATNVVVGSATSITADINLSGKATGLWTVVVTNPDTSVSSFPSGFSVYNRSAIFMGIGDSISMGSTRYIGPEQATPSGNFLSQFYPYLSDITSGTLFYNAGIGSTTSANTNTRIQALLTSKTPSKVYVHVGINDLTGSISLSSYLSNLSAILTKVTNASAELILNQILPYPGSGGIYTENVKIWNAAVEKFGYDNNVKISPTYQEFSNLTTDDAINIDYNGGDNAHPSIIGYARIATLMANAGVPTKKRVWGSTSYPGFSYESWKWFVFAGGGSVTGNSDTGSMNLPQNATASSNVLAIQSGSKPIAITATTSSGSVSISYRTSSTNFFRNNGAISWTTYTGPFTLSSDQFIQVRLTGTSASTATVDDLTMRWAPSTVTFTGPSSGSVNSASTNFTITPDNLYTGTVTITPSGGGLSTPTVLVFSNSATPQTFTITPTDSGVITLTPSNSGSLSNPSVLTYTVNAVAPDAPTNVVATGGDSEAVVTFDAPTSNGGSSIISYTVTSTPGSITANGSASPITIAGLTNNTGYTFVVTATNIIGTSSASTPSNSVTPVAAQQSRRIINSGSLGRVMTSAVNSIDCFYGYKFSPSTGKPCPTSSSSTTPTTSPISSPFVRDLKLNMVGPDVLALQKYLNTHGFPVTLSGVGSKGFETTKFGTLTQKALSKFQLANKISPAVGYFGPVTRAFIQK
jgi:lysophospholipase L1-like esterase